MFLPEPAPSGPPPPRSPKRGLPAGVLAALALVEARPRYSLAIDLDCEVEEIGLRSTNWAAIDKFLIHLDPGPID